ncbi:MAG: hypothetical protein BWY77_01915 [bacterium ADurb.Bin431]|nr:MAG: hypothetical protein BWY77_01915 [bacterium ADurb.Bin431]
MRGPLLQGDDETAHIAVIAVDIASIGLSAFEPDNLLSQQILDILEIDRRIDGHIRGQLMLEAGFPTHRRFRLEIGIADHGREGAELDLVLGVPVERFEIRDLGKMAVGKMDHPLVRDRKGQTQPRAQLGLHCGASPRRGEHQSRLLVRHGGQAAMSVEIVEPQPGVNDDLLVFDLVLYEQGGLDRLVGIFVILGGLAAGEIGNEEPFDLVVRAVHDLAPGIAQAVALDLDAGLEQMDGMHLGGQLQPRYRGAVADFAVLVVAGIGHIFQVFLIVALIDLFGGDRREEIALIIGIGEKAAFVRLRQLREAEGELAPRG